MVGEDFVVFVVGGYGAGSEGTGEGLFLGGGQEGGDGRGASFAGFGFGGGGGFGGEELDMMYITTLSMGAVEGEKGGLYSVKLPVKGNKEDVFKTSDLFAFLDSGRPKKWCPMVETKVKE